jgi:hypothetical protein
MNNLFHSKDLYTRTSLFYRLQRQTFFREVEMMRKEIVLVLVAAVLLLGAAAAFFESITVNAWKAPVFDPEDPHGGEMLQPNGDDMYPAPL